MREEYIRHGLDQNHAVVSPPCVRVTPDPVAPAPRPTQGRLLFVGRLTWAKGADLLLASLPMIQERLGKPLHATIVGDGDQADLLLIEATRPPLPEVSPTPSAGRWPMRNTTNGCVRERGAWLVPWRRQIMSGYSSTP